MIQSLPSGSRQHVSNHLTTDSLGQRAAILGFRDDDEPLAPKCGDIGRRRAFLALRMHQKIASGLARVIAKHIVQRHDQRAFAIGPVAYEREQHLLAHLACECIACERLKELNQFAVVLRRPIEKPGPMRAIAAGSNGTLICLVM